MKPGNSVKSEKSLSSRVIVIFSVIGALIIAAIVIITIMMTSAANRVIVDNLPARYVFSSYNNSEISGLPSDSTVYLMLDNETDYVYLCISSNNGVALTPLLDENGNPTRVSDDFVIEDELNRNSAADSQ